MFKNKISNVSADQIVQVTLRGASRDSVPDESEHRFHDCIIDLKEKECDLTSSVYDNFIRYPKVILRMVGLYHRKSDRLILKIYRLGCMTLLWINTIRFILSIDIFRGKKPEPFSSNFILKIILFIWSFSVSFNSTIIFYNQEKDSRESKFLDYFYAMLNYKGNNLKMTKKVVYLMFIVATMIGLLNCIALVAGVFGPEEFFKVFSIYLSPFGDDAWAKESIVYKASISFITCIGPMNWLTALAYFLTHTSLVIMLFENYVFKFKKFVHKSVLTSKDNPKLYREKVLNHERLLDEQSVCWDSMRKIYVCENELDNFRQWHLKLSYLVSLLDNCYKEIIAVNLFCNLIIILLMLYLISDWAGNCMSGLVALLVPFWLIACLILALVIVIFSAKIMLLVSLSSFL